MKNFIDGMELNPEEEALLVGLHEQREAIDTQLDNLPPTAENRKRIFGLQNQRNKVVGQINAVIFGSDKEYADKEFGYQVFKYVADNPQMDKGKRENIKEAMESARIQCKREQDWVEEVKGNSYLFTADNFKELASNGDLKLLMKFKTLKKRHIINRSTLNSAVGEFSDQKSMAETLDSHDRRIRELERDTKKLNKTQEAQQAHLKLIDNILGDSKPDWKSRAAMLKNRGFSQEAIASALDVSVSTIKRHWKILK